MYQPLKFGAFIVRPGQPVISVNINNDILALEKFLDILRDDFPLVGYAQTLVVPVVFG